MKNIKYCIFFIVLGSFLMLKAQERPPINVFYSNDYRVNTQLGILAIKAKDWKKAEAYLQTAADRITMNYTRAKDGEALYYLGITQRALGKTQDAYDNLYKATWSSAWHSAAYYQLAEMDCNTGDFDKALVLSYYRFQHLLLMHDLYDNTKVNIIKKVRRL